MQLTRWWIGLTLLYSLLFVSVAPAWAVDTAAEQTILDVIAKHPEAIVQAFKTHHQQQQQSQQQARAQSLQRISQDVSRFVAQSPTRGVRFPFREASPTSKVTLIEFADFQCPYCAQAHQPIDTLLSKHPEVSFVFKHLPLSEIHAQALPAAKAAWAAGQQGKFWEFYDLVFEQTATLGEPIYEQIAQQLELDPHVFERDRNSLAATQAIQADVAQATSIGINGTPFFLVVGKTGVQPISGADMPAIEAQINQFSTSKG